ncbi:MAG: sigma 54-interacting transcriptional regulator, partial [Myxococcota bacterium]
MADSSETVEFADQGVRSGGTMEVFPGDVIELGTAVVVVQHAVSRGRPRRLWAHGYFEGRLEEECARAERNRSTFTVLRLHVGSAADSSAVEHGLAAATRSVDVVAAYGPGEYEVLAVDVDEERGATLRGRIAAELEARGLQPRIGMANYPRDGRNPDRLIARACERARDQRKPASEGPLVVVDPAMQRLYALAERVADSKICVLLMGETGVGKEVLAEAIHKHSPRARTPMLRINCAALSASLLESELFGHERGAFTGAGQAKQGLLEAAHGGTVFLDEIGELPLTTQAKLLRVFEGNEVILVGAVKPRRIDVRFVAATNRDLEEGTRQGTFREDLYFRLSGVSLVIPPLRERSAEIEPLARAFMRQFARTDAPQITADALAWLEGYSWPGNVRELRNVIERAMLLAGDDEVRLEHLPV